MFIKFKQYIIIVLQQHKQIQKQNNMKNIKIYLYKDFDRFEDEFLEGFKAELLIKTTKDNDNLQGLLKDFIINNKDNGTKSFIFCRGVHSLSRLKKNINSIGYNLKDINFLYTDTGYFSNLHQSKKKQHRVVVNELQNSKFEDEQNAERFKKTGLKLNNWQFNKDGHILIAPPSNKSLKKLYQSTEDEWIIDKINKLKNITEREIKIRRKVGNRRDRKITLSSDLKNCYCLITEHSLIAFEALYYGIPVISLDKINISNSPNGLDGINNLNFYEYRQKIFNKLANHNFELREIVNQVALRTLFSL